VLHTGQPDKSQSKANNQNFTTGPAQPLVHVLLSAKLYFFQENSTSFSKTSSSKTSVKVRPYFFQQNHTSFSKTNSTAFWSWPVFASKCLDGRHFLYLSKITGTCWARLVNERRHGFIYTRVNLFLYSDHCQ
jgi:hypothetical protein